MVYPLIRRLILVLIALTGSLASLPAAADVQPVMLSTAVAKTGGSARVAFHFAIAPGWHIYWLNPGETGLPTAVQWTLPPGAHAGTMVWPAPERLSGDGIINYGYRHAVTLIAALSPGQTGSATADVSWLACAQMCIPQEQKVTLALDRSSGDQTLFTQSAGPQPFGGTASVTLAGKRIILSVDTPALKGVTPQDVLFFPLAQRVIDSHTPEAITLDGTRATIALARYRHPHPLGHFDGVLEIAGRGSWTVTPDFSPARPSPAPEHNTPVELLAAIAFAFLGGLILNGMPCVLPVLAMKALAFVQARESASELREEGVFYMAGVIASFMAMAAMIQLLRAAGHLAGWGFQLQSPAVVAILALLCIGIGLNFLGLFEMPSIAGFGSGLVAQGARPSRAFFTGALAVAVASPCTAPFMGTAVGFALTQSGTVSLAIFLSLALGFAAPFTALTFIPGLVRLIPRPGRWMNILKEALAFPMFATAVWLVWVLDMESGPTGLVVTLSAAIGLTFLVWLMRHVNGSLVRYAAGAGAVAILAALIIAVPAAAPASNASDTGGWRPWSPQAVEEAQAQGHPVFVDFGAAWCVTCLANEHIALDAASVRSAFARAGVVTLKADWTDRNPKISAVLQQFGRAGVPLYLLYPSTPGAAPLVLPQLLTPDAVRAKMKAL